jgi:hypothetical protein
MLNRTSHRSRCDRCPRRRCRLGGRSTSSANHETVRRAQFDPPMTGHVGRPDPAGRSHCDPTCRRPEPWAPKSRHHTATIRPLQDVPARATSGATTREIASCRGGQHIGPGCDHGQCHGLFRFPHRLQPPSSCRVGTTGHGQLGQRFRRLECPHFTDRRVLQQIGVPSPMPWRRHTHV